MTYNNLPNLDEVVLAALDFFSQNKPSSLNLKQYSFPIVVGSGNAYNTAQVIFADQAAIIATESNFKQTLIKYNKLIKNKSVSEVIIISASGEKDSIWEIKLAKKNKLKTVLLTCSPGSSAAKLADQVQIFKKLPEPYTYNTSTYLAIMLAAGKEDVSKVKDFIKKLRLVDFKKYEAFSFILPDEFGAISPMLEIKRNELFGPYVSLRAFSFGEARHAKFVNQHEKELVISFGENKYFGLEKNRWQIKIPKQAGNSFIMALAYYLIGKIQASKPAYFKKNIEKFCLEGPKAYGVNKPFSVIVK